MSANWCTADVQRLGGMKGSAELFVTLNLKKMKFDKKDVDALFQKTNRGIFEYRKALVIDALKKMWTIVWTITIFPLILLRECLLGRFINGK